VQTTCGYCEGPVDLAGEFNQVKPSYFTLTSNCIGSTSAAVLKLGNNTTGFLFGSAPDQARIPPLLYFWHPSIPTRPTWAPAARMPDPGAGGYCTIQLVSRPNLDLE
jgi:hypothetical protein